MSSEAVDAAVDQNAQAAEDTKQLLAELQSESNTGDQEPQDNEVKNRSEETTNKDQPPKEEKENSKASEHSESRKQHGNRNGHKGDNQHRGGQGGRGRGGFRKNVGRDNIKSDLTTQEVSNDPVAIRKQVEFYFSDSNLPMDKFLLSKVGGSKNNAVEISVLHSFKRMRHFQPFEAIVDALKESELLELTDNDTAVRRKEPLPRSLDEGGDPTAVKVFEDNAMPRSVYVKGFGEEQPSTQFDIEAFFAPYGPTNAIRLRRTDDKLFKRSVFVEFENEELAKKFLELDPKPKFKGKDLLIMSKKEYCDKKVEDIKSGKIRPNSRHGHGGNKYNKDGRDFKRKRDNEDDRDWRQRREEDRKNGFRDDRRQGNRDRDYRAKGGRDRRGDIEKDDRGVPVVKSSAANDAQREEALAKARAVVEQENQKSKVDASEEAAEGANKKRSRDEEGIEGEERESKKQDVKTDT